MGRFLGTKWETEGWSNFFSQVYLNYEGDLKDDNMIEMNKKK